MFHLAQTPRRAPFADWLAQVGHILARRRVAVEMPAHIWRGMYDVGLSPREVADDFLEDDA